MAGSVISCVAIKTNSKSEAGGEREAAMRKFWHIVVVLALAAAPLRAHAQEGLKDYPVKPIRLVVPFPPGGPNDIIGRVVGQKMQELLGQLVIIDNRGGAGGVIGTDNVAKAEPDGYAIAIGSAGALAISSSLQAKLPYDPVGKTSRRSRWWPKSRNCWSLRPRCR